MSTFQRDRIRDLADWRREVARLRIASDVSPAERLHRLGRLAELLRLSPRHVEESIALLGEALRAARGPRHVRARAIVRLRMAIAHQYAGRPRDALRWFRLADRTVREARLPRLRDFVLQHRGKCLAELGRIAEARRCFREALRLRTRRRRPDPGLVASTRRALAGLPEET